MAIKTPTTETDADPSARRPGETVDEHERRLRQIEKNQAAIALLRSLREVDEEGARSQRETWDLLKKALDEDRPSYRKLFSCD